jgi:hypothetical protein
MADYQFNTNLTPNIQGTNIADMVNLARGVQAYQQAEQANPLAIQRAQMEIEQAKKMNPLVVQKSTEEVKQAETGTKKGQFELNSIQTQKLYDLAGGVLNDPRIKSGNRAEVISALNEAKKRAHTYNIPEETVEGVFAPIMNQAVTNPKSVAGVLSNIVQSGLGATGQQTLQTPSLVTTPGGLATFKTGGNVLEPAQIGGQQPPTPPTPQSPMQPQGGAQPQGQPSGVTPTQMSLPYPVRRAGDIRPLAPSEEADRENGQKYRESLAQSTTNLSKSIRNIDEVIKDAEKIASKEWNRGAGFAGTVGRNVSTFLGTDMGIEYARLSKSLAQLQLALGADTTTDRGKDLMAAANGTITLPPDVLQEIAHRTKAEKQNIEMQSQGAQVFSQKYGDANLKKFQKDWADNSKDSRVLEAISIHNSDMSAEDKQTQINRLFENASPKYLEDVKRYRRNLEKLSKTGGL